MGGGGGRRKSVKNIRIRIMWENERSHFSSGEKIRFGPGYFAYFVKKGTIVTSGKELRRGQNNAKKSRKNPKRLF